MKRIATGLSLALFILTNSGYGQSLDSIESRYAQSRKLIEALAKTKINDKDLLSITKTLQKNIKLDPQMLVQGGVDSGGGTLVRSGQRQGLLDLYLYNQPAFFSLEKGVELPSTRTYRDYDFDVLENSRFSVVQESLGQLEKWHASSPFMVPFVTQALKELPLFYVKSNLAFRDQMAFIPRDMKFPEGSLHLGAYYVKNLGTLIEKKSFDHLSLKNQMALIIHESLRHQQMTFHSGMSNEEVQKLTGLIMGDPEPGISLDRVAYLNPLLQRLLQQAEIDLQIRNYADDICRAVPPSCSLMRENDPSYGDNNGLIQLMSAIDKLFKYQRNSKYWDLPKQERDRLAKLSDDAMEFAKHLYYDPQVSPKENLTPGYSHYSWTVQTKQLMAKLAHEYNQDGTFKEDGGWDLIHFIDDMKKMGVLVD